MRITEASSNERSRITLFPALKAESLKDRIELWGLIERDAVQLAAMSLEQRLTGKRHVRMSTEAAQHCAYWDGLVVNVAP